MDKPTKQGGIWSYIGIYILCVIIVLIVILKLIIISLFFLPAPDTTTNLFATVAAIIAFITSIVSTILAVHFYAKIRIITKKFIKRISLIYWIFCGLYTLYYIAMILINQGIREWINLIYWIITVPIVFILMRKSLLRKVKQQETY